MGNRPSTLVVQQAPILKLHRDLLWEIFARCDSLNNIRRASQVCRMWREFLLSSPSIWARNIDLHTLEKASNRWRHLVLKRTGKAALSVTRRLPGQWRSETHPNDFFVKCLKENWERIQDLKIEVTQRGLDDERVWRVFGRPAPVLRTFSCKIYSPRHPAELPPPLQNLPPNFRLFSNRASSLVELRLPRQFPAACINLTSPTLFTNNMRDLTLTQPLMLKTGDLLTACMQMPLIENLSLSLARFVRSALSEMSTLHPPVTRLKSITLTDADPSIYPAFLDRIVPSPSCRLVIEHRLDAWSGLVTDTSAKEDIAHMHRVLERYANSYFEHEAASFEKIGKLILTVSQHAWNFSIAGQHGYFSIDVEHRHQAPHLSLNILLLLFDSLSTFRVPQNITTLEFDFCDRDNFLRHAPLPGVFRSMNSITTLEVSQDGLSYLGQFIQPELPFPHLDTISLGMNSFERLQESILPFISNRYHTTPIKVLTFDCLFMKPADLRFLDAFFGLKVVWRAAGELNTSEYVCGSGDALRLYVLGSPSAKGH